MKHSVLCVNGKRTENRHITKNSIMKVLLPLLQASNYPNRIISPPCFRKHQTPIIISLRIYLYSSILTSSHIEIILQDGRNINPLPLLDMGLAGPETRHREAAPGATMGRLLMRAPIVHTIHVENPRAQGVEIDFQLRGLAFLSFL